LERQDVAGAITDATEAIRLDPSFALAFFNRGNALAFVNRGYNRYQKGDVDGAIADYDEAIRLSAPSSNLYVERGYLRLAAGNTDASIADFSAAIRLNPSSASAYNNRGLAFRKKGDTNSAYDDYSAAIAINPAYALAYANRGYLNEKKGRKAHAISDLRRAIVLDPSLTAASEALARLGAATEAQQESAARIRAGGLLAGEYCSGCHAIGPQGTSNNKRAPEFRSIARRHPLLALREPIARGIAATHEEMPRLALTEKQVDSIIAYINDLGGKSAHR
jgi:tetratricopeptide (TPR) repeat protein